MSQPDSSTLASKLRSVYQCALRDLSKTHLRMAVPGTQSTVRDVLNSTEPGDAIKAILQPHGIAVSTKPRDRISQLLLFCGETSPLLNKTSAAFQDATSTLNHTDIEDEVILRQLDATTRLLLPQPASTIEAEKPPGNRDPPSSTAAVPREDH